jgi:hypothetical protein
VVKEIRFSAPLLFFALCALPSTPVMHFAIPNHRLPSHPQKRPHLSCNQLQRSPRFGMLKAGDFKATEIITPGIYEASPLFAHHPAAGRRLCRS